MKLKKIIWMLTFFVLAGTVAACGRKEKTEEDTQTVQNEQAREPKESAQKEKEQEKRYRNNLRSLKRRFLPTRISLQGSRI